MSSESLSWPLESSGGDIRSGTAGWAVAGPGAGVLAGVSQAHPIASRGTLSTPLDEGGAGLQRRVLNSPLKNVICQPGDVRKVRPGKLARHRQLPDGVNSSVGS